MSWGRTRPTGRWPWPRAKPVPPPTPVVVIDEDDADDDSEVFIINDAAEIARAAAACNSKKGNSSGSNVINIDDDDEEDGEEEGGGGAAAGDRAGPSTAGAGGRSPATSTPPGRAAPRNRYGLNYVSDSEQSDLSEGSDSESDGDGSSDCEMLGDIGMARKVWESAASRRTTPHHHPPQRKDGSRASTSASSAESSTHHDENFGNLFVPECPLDDNIFGYFRSAFNPDGQSSADGAKHGAGPSSACNIPEFPMDHDSNGRKTEDCNPTCSLNPDMTPPKNDTLETSSLYRKDFVDDPEKLGLSAVVQDGPDFQDGLIGAREKHKESDEYKRAAEEEWASRQRQLAIQAEEAKEAKRLRKRKKAEALRLVDMQKRQKQRLEEVRETQRKGEEDIQLKEQCRGAVRLELENMERACTDVPSILRALGIPVHGVEVKAAYKRALLKFHPDRVSRTDIYQQVKAEETFKFISRFKEKLKL